MARRLLNQLTKYSFNVFFRDYKYYAVRSIMVSSVINRTAREEKQLLAFKDRYFEQDTKDKQTFLDIVDLFTKKNYKTGHIEFIYAAMKRMKEYGVEDDLETYNKLIDVMPKGKMVSGNVFLSDFMYFPKHQFCIQDLLLQMEERRIIPNIETQELIIRIFGSRSIVARKLFRMLYWLPKLKYASPWPPPEPRPKDAIEVAKLGIARMCSVDLETEVTLFQTKEDELATEDTWIVNGQSPIQKTLLEYHPENIPLYVEGSFKMYLGRKDSFSYYILRADLPKNRRRRTFKDPDVIKNLKIPFFDPPKPDDLIPNFSVHEQRDGIIYATAVTGKPGKNSLLSWIRLLEKNGNPRLAKIPVVFKGKSPLGKVQDTELIEVAEENSSKAEKNG